MSKTLSAPSFADIENNSLDNIFSCGVTHFSEHWENKAGFFLASLSPKLIRSDGEHMQSALAAQVEAFCNLISDAIWRQITLSHARNSIFGAAELFYFYIKNGNSREELSSFQLLLSSLSSYLQNLPSNSVFLRHFCINFARFSWKLQQNLMSDLLIQN